jgi:hypothetical protein
MAQLQVATANVIQGEAGAVVFGPRVDPTQLLEVPTTPNTATQVSQVVVMAQDENPKSHGTLQTPIVFGYLSSADFDRLKSSLLKRKSGDPPITFEWEVGQYDFLTSFSYRM